jgi:uncharacterized protein
MSGLPAVIDPVLLADRGTRLTGKVPMKGMSRLAEHCLDERGEASVDLDFRRDGELREMVGEVRARFRVRCQRCLEAMELEVEARLGAILLRPGERADLVESEADTLVADKPVSLSELVEDELILAMPMFPVHAPGKCPAGAAGDALSGKKNPFSVLQGMRKTDR